ncbi:hypothetical protein CIW54_27945 (plasmid) [Paraburkholderia sp. T12-10]|nr:hypothetical protein CIW54_27945 [Paraburkholderia sp. T12-10]
MKIQSIAPCTGWYYTAKGARDEDIVFDVAAWAITDAGEVVGMISASDAATDDGVARLVAPPPIKGMYVPAERLTERQKVVAARG